MAKKETEGSYLVGYGKPPADTRFKPGQSGNPRGRPKGTRNLATLVKKVFSRKIGVQDQGSHRRITLAEAMVTKIMTKAVNGDPTAQRISIALMQTAESDAPPSTSLFSSDDDRELLRKGLLELNGTVKRKKKGGAR